MVSLRRLLVALLGLVLIGIAGVLGWDWSLASPALDGLPGRAHETAVAILEHPADRNLLVGVLAIIGLPLVLLPSDWLRAGAWLVARATVSLVGLAAIGLAVALAADGVVEASAAAYGASVPVAGQGGGAVGSLTRYAAAGAAGVIGLALLIAPWRRRFAAL